MSRLTLLVSLAVVATLISCSKKPELTDFSPDGTSLVVQMPRPIRHQSREATLADQAVTARAYTAVFDGVVYAVNYQRLAPVVREEMRRRPRDVVLDSAKGELVRSTGSTVLKEVGAELRTSTGSYLGREISLRLPDGRHKMIARVFPTDDMYVQVAVTLPLEPSYNQEIYATRFIKSARLR